MPFPLKIVTVDRLAAYDRRVTRLRAQIVELHAKLDAERASIMDAIKSELQREYEEYAGKHGGGARVKGKALASVRDRARLEGFLAGLNKAATAAAKVIWKPTVEPSAGAEAVYGEDGDAKP